MAGGDADTFTIAQTTTDPALSTGKIRIEHNDGRANPFQFSIAVTSIVSLSATLSGNTLRLSWRVTAQNHQLQATSVLGPKASWSAFPSAPTLANGVATVTLPIDPGGAFYRLGPQ